MDESHEVHDVGAGPSRITRRDALKTGAIVGGAAFVIPAVQTISMSRASAQTASGPGGGGTVGRGDGEHNGWGHWHDHHHR